MAIYHLHCQIIGKSSKTEIKADGSKGSKRSSMASAVASAAYRAGTMLKELAQEVKGKESIIEAAAYRSGERLQGQQSAKYHDYRFKGGVVHSEIMLPPHAPPEYRDRQTLWNAVHKIEGAKDAQLAREFNIALHNELSMSRNLALIREYVKVNFVDKGMCADIAIHNPKRRSKVDNLHAHVMLTMRPINPDGSWGQKAKKEYIYDNAGNHILDDKGRWKSRSVHLIDWNKHSTFLEWRKSWADLSNAYFERADLDVRISEKSFEELGIDLTPTKHMGKDATALERKGVTTERGEENRAIAARNVQRLKELFGFPLATAAELVSRKVHELSFAANRQLTESQYVQTELFADPQQRNVPDQRQQLDHSQELPPGIESERRTYTPSSGVVRQGIPLHPKEAVFEPPDARKEVPRLSGNRETGITDPALTRQGLQMPVRAALHGSIGQTIRLKLAAHIGVKRTLELRRPSRRQRHENIQKMGRILDFLASYKLDSMVALQQSLNRLEDRLSTLQSHIERVDATRKQLRHAAEICKLNYEVVDKYNRTTFFRQKFYNQHKSEIDSFAAAQKLLRSTGRYNEKTDPQLFTALLAKLDADRAKIVEELRSCKNDLMLHKIHRANINEVLGIERPQPARSKSVLDQKLEQAKARQKEQPEFAPKQRSYEKER